MVRCGWKTILSSAFSSVAFSSCSRFIFHRNLMLVVSQTCRNLPHKVLGLQTPELFVIDVISRIVLRLILHEDLLSTLLTLRLE